MLVTQPAFRSEYVRLKNKYGKYWVSRWPGERHLFARSHCIPACSDSVVRSFFFAEQTDPSKYVFEEIAIAAWLLALWKGESTADQDGEQQRCVRFVDLGCGNGFLTYLLIEEGHTGWGIDRQRRGIWGEYPVAVQVRDLACSIEAYTQNDLVQSEHDTANCVACPPAPAHRTQQSLLCAEFEFSVQCVDTLSDQFEGVQWVLGNHTDELTPWVPLITKHLAEREQERHTDHEKCIDLANQQDQHRAPATVGVAIAASGADSEGTVNERAAAAIRHASIDVAQIERHSAEGGGSRAKPPLLPQYWVLPCCLWDIGPQGVPVKFIGHDTSLGRYHTCVCVRPCARVADRPFSFIRSLLTCVV